MPPARKVSAHNYSVKANHKLFNWRKDVRVLEMDAAERFLSLSLKMELARTQFIRQEEIYFYEKLLSEKYGYVIS